jgi:hypothetical protein
LEDASNRELGPINFESSDANGQFLFAGVSAGRYLLSVNRTGHPDRRNPANAYAPSFYPGVTDGKEARVITLAPGEKLADLEVLITKRTAGVPRPQR